MRSGRRKRRWILSSGLPEDAITGAARITLSGKSAALIEGQCGVVEMKEVCIRLKSMSGIVRICGSGLRVKELSVDAALITGAEITSIQYE